MMNILETVRDTDIVSVEYWLGLTYAILEGIISNDLEWLGKIFNDMQHRGVCLRHLSLLLDV